MSSFYKLNYKKTSNDSDFLELIIGSVPTDPTNSY